MTNCFRILKVQYYVILSFIATLIIHFFTFIVKYVFWVGFLGFRLWVNLFKTDQSQLKNYKILSGLRIFTGPSNLRYAKKLIFRFKTFILWGLATVLTNLYFLIHRSSYLHPNESKITRMWHKIKNLIEEPRLY